MENTYNWTEIKEKLAQNTKNPKVGILIAAYGSSNTQSSQAIRRFQARLEQYFGVPVRLAFTSETLRKRLAHAKTKSDSVLKALKKMEFERFTHVIVQSLHLIAGIEYHEVLADTKIAEESGALKTAFGLPLLHQAKDVDAVVCALTMLLPENFQKNDAAVWMGHGTSHNAEELYLALSQRIHEYNENLYTACMEGIYTLEHVLKDLKKKQTVHTVWLLPLLTAVGKHALCDMAGDEPTSWKNQIISQGYSCTPYLKGLAESLEIQNIWIERIKQAILTL